MGSRVERRWSGTRVAKVGLSAAVGAAALSLSVIPVAAAGSAWTWTVVASPDPTPEQSAFFQNQLLGMSCLTATDCWAVGNTGTTSGIEPEIERYDGSSWLSVASPAVSGNLWGVTCVSAADCWAVGREDQPTTSTYVTLIEHYDGASWTVSSSPNVTQAQIDSLQSVSCTSAGCMAVGYYGVFIPSVGASVQQTLIEKYDPTSNTWAIASSPDTSPVLNNSLNGVSCPGSTDCWATGTASTASGSSQTLVESWNGTSWTIVGSPNPGSSNNYLLQVSCVSGTACWAAGANDNGTTQQALIESYDGTAWSTTGALSSDHRQLNVLEGIDCSARTQCAAVGIHGDNLGSTFGLAETFDGSAWTLAGVQATPGNPTANNQVEDLLYSVSCPTTVECWAVGYQLDWHGGNGGNLNLVEHGVAPSPGSGVPEAPWAALLLAPGALSVAVVASGRWRRIEH